MSDVIEFTAQVYKVQTLATDQGIRVTLDLPETAIMQMAMLAECQRAGVYLSFVATSDKQGKTGNVKQMATGPKRKSSWTPAQE